MKKIVLITLLISIVSCSKTLTKEEIMNINGYWRIDKVTIENETVQLPPSIHMDFFYIDEELQGFRKKLSVNLVGNFEKNNHDEKIVIQNQEEGTFILYTTAYDSWKEELLSISDKELVILNTEGKTYTYKRFSEEE